MTYEEMRDPGRKARLHVENVRTRTVKEAYGVERVAATIILSDETTMSWEQWLAGGRDALRRSEW
jgi:hypothetical protein